MKAIFEIRTCLDVCVDSVEIELPADFIDPQDCAGEALAASDYAGHGRCGQCGDNAYRAYYAGTPVNSIVIPERFVAVCADWHGGQGCMLYAIASTGGLTTGTIRPAGCSDMEWYYTLWCDLAFDVGFAVRAAHTVCGDLSDLNDFEDWVDAIVDRLTEEYGIND